MKLSIRISLLFFCLTCLLAGNGSDGFTTPSSSSLFGVVMSPGTPRTPSREEKVHPTASSSSRLCMSGNDDMDDDNDTDDEERRRLEAIERLGFTQKRDSSSSSLTPTTTRRSQDVIPDESQEQKVNVNEMDVDPLTLTAVGFAAIAVNFLVFANMGDGGISGIVARIINTVNQ